MLGEFKIKLKWEELYLNLKKLRKFQMKIQIHIKIDQF